MKVSDKISDIENQLKCKHYSRAFDLITVAMNCANPPVLAFS